MRQIPNRPQHGFAKIKRGKASLHLEYKWVGVPQSDHPVVVFLHEALGSMALWKDFPERFCNHHGLSGLVFSRYGYGRSTPRPAIVQKPQSYLNEEVHELMPALFAELGIKKPWLFGHSEGGIASLLYAAAYPDSLSGAISIAPHTFIDDLTIKGIEETRALYDSTDFRQKIGCYHDDPETIFSLWVGTWLNPEFRSWNIENRLVGITSPILVLQGEHDEYGTLEQIYRVKKHVPHAQLLVLPECGHFPHRDKAEELISRAGQFIKAHFTSQQSRRPEHHVC